MATDEFCFSIQIWYGSMIWQQMSFVSASRYDTVQWYGNRWVLFQHPNMTQLKDMATYVFCFSISIWYRWKIWQQMSFVLASRYGMVQWYGNRWVLFQHPDMILFNDMVTDEFCFSIQIWHNWKIWQHMCFVSASLYDTVERYGNRWVLF